MREVRKRSQEVRETATSQVKSIPYIPLTIEATLRHITEQSERAQLSMSLSTNKRERPLLDRLKADSNYMPPPQDSKLLPKLSRNSKLSMRSSDVCRNDINTIQALMQKHDIGHSEVH